MVEGHPYPATHSPPPHQSPRLLSAQDEKTWALMAHLSALSGLVIGFGVFLGPLVVWLLGREKSPFIDRHGKEALNFGITVGIVWFVFTIAALVVGIATFGIGLIMFIPLGLALAALWAVFVVIATIKASNGEDYQYPISFRFVR